MKVMKKNRGISYCLMTMVSLVLCLMIWVVPAEAANYTLTANNNWVNGTIATQGDMNMYSVTLARAGSLHVDYQGWSIADSYIGIYDADLVTQFENQNVYTSSNASPITRSYDLWLEAGTYNLKVWGDGNHVGDYRIRCSFAAAYNTEKEPNNEFAQAMPLGANQTVTGLLSRTDNTDFYRIQVPSAQKITVTYQGRIADSYFQIWDQNYQEVFKRNVYTASETAPLTYVWTPDTEVAAGTYYIKIYPYSNHTGRYSIRWTGPKVSTTPTVQTVKVSSLKISGNKVVAPGQTFTLKATASPSNATNKKVTWTSSNPKVASVASNGKVTAKRIGKTVITAKAKDGSGIVKTCSVIVKPKKMAITKLTKVGTGKVKVIWKKQSGVSGYQLCYSTSSSFASYRLLGLKKTMISKTISGLKAKKYYVKLRAYVTIDSKKYYGSWGSKKTVDLRKK